MKYIVSGSGMLDVNNWLELCYLAPATFSKSPTFTSKATLSVCTEGLSAIQARAVQALIDVLRTLGPCPSRLAFSTKGTIKTGSASTGESPVLVLTCATVEAGWFHTFICKCQVFQLQITRNMILQFFLPMSSAHRAPVHPDWHRQVKVPIWFWHVAPLRQGDSDSTHSSARFFNFKLQEMWFCYMEGSLRDASDLLQP